MLDELLLISGNDIPFISAKLIIHQPKIKEIAYITENRFWPGCEFLKFTKDSLMDQDKKDLLNYSDFNIIMSMMLQKNIQSYRVRTNVLSVLALLFPQYKISLSPTAIKLQHFQKDEKSQINQNCFQQFKNILIDMFCLTDKENKQYNPSGDLAKKIAQKIKQGRAKKAQLAPEQKIAVLSRYVSILAVGQQKSINDLMNYTVYQLIDEFNRFCLKLNYDAWMSFKLAGATGMQDAQDWLKDIHEENNNL